MHCGDKCEKQIDVWNEDGLAAVPQKMKLQSMAMGWQTAMICKETWIQQITKTAADRGTELGEGSDSKLQIGSASPNVYTHRTNQPAGMAEYDKG